MKVIASTIAALGLVWAATPAMAETAQTRTVAVKTGDLDLASDAGRKELNWRIDRAIRKVCDTASLTRGAHTPAPQARSCITDARTGAERQIVRLMTVETRKNG